MAGNLGRGRAQGRGDAPRSHRGGATAAGGARVGTPRLLTGDRRAEGSVFGAVHARGSRIARTRSGARGTCGVGRAHRRPARSGRAARDAGSRRHSCSACCEHRRGRPRGVAARRGCGARERDARARYVGSGFGFGIFALCARSQEGMSRVEWELDTRPYPLSHSNVTSAWNFSMKGT